MFELYMDVGSLKVAGVEKYILADYEGISLRIEELDEALPFFVEFLVLDKGSTLTAPLCK